MTKTDDALFKTLADPTRRAIFERLIRDGEQTVRALTDKSGVLPAGSLQAPQCAQDRRSGA